MFNPNIGTENKVGEKTYILTRLGASGHAIWGDYIRVQPGRYCVIFDISTPKETQDTAANSFGILEVVSDWGRKTIASVPILADNLNKGGRGLRVDFTISDKNIVEPRVYVEGNQALLIAEHPRPIQLSNRPEEDEDRIAATRFPDANAGGVPEFFRSNVERFRALHGARIWTRADRDEVTLDVDGVVLQARGPDDVRDIEHIFVSNIYNIFFPRDVCVIDIGMNLGLASLLFANRPNVREVHAFEPFEETYRRAIANIALNPRLGPKISAYNFALSDKDEERQVRVETQKPSALWSLHDKAEVGAPAIISIRDAAKALRPIINAAQARGLTVAAKLNCEGSEYEIFESLEKAELLHAFSAFIVESHPISASKGVEDIIGPLLSHGFVVFDRTPRKDGANGMVYAVRLT